MVVDWNQPGLPGLGTERPTHEKQATWDGGALDPAELQQWAGQRLITQGLGAGEPFAFLPFILRFLEQVLQPAVSVAGLSVARGNTKSTSMAALGAMAVDGPLVRDRADVICVSGSQDQSKIVVNHARHFLIPEWPHYDRRRWRVQEFPIPMITNLRTGVALRGVTAKPETSLGEAPGLILADEPAAWGKAKSDDGGAMYQVMRTSLGKVSGSKLLVFGTQAAHSDHWWSRLLDGQGADHVQLHAASSSEPPFERGAILAANPFATVNPMLMEAIESDAEAAMVDPAAEAAYRNYRLNQRVAATPDLSLVDPDLWLASEGAAEQEGASVWGVDLGTTRSASAVVSYWPQTGRLRTLAAFPRNPHLLKRETRDAAVGVYTQAVGDGHLLQLGDLIVPVAELLTAARERFGAPAVIVADRWREGELREALAEARIPRAELVLRGQGFKDGGEDVRTFRSALASGEVAAERSVLLRHSLAECVTESDPAGNQKINRRTRHAFNDPAVAAVLAVAQGRRMAGRRQKRRPLRLIPIG